MRLCQCKMIPAGNPAGRPLVTDIVHRLECNSFGRSQVDKKYLRTGLDSMTHLNQ